MAISIHLISIPSDEVVTSRVVYLPNDGGQLGRAASCDVVLPDQSKRISRIHGLIRLSDTGYVIKCCGKNPAQLNDKAMVREKDYPLNDGDILKIEQYSMLVSTLTASTAQLDTKADEPAISSSFNLSLDDEDIDFLDQTEVTPLGQQKTNYSHNNVLSDDPFSIDPFEDLEQELEPELKVEIEQVEQQKQAVEQASELEYLPISNNHQLEASIEKLISISEKNNQNLRNPPLAHDALFAALDKTLDQFLTEFAPNQLESQFSEFVSGGVFSSKEKKYWKIYRRHYQHRSDNGDFRRQFKAIFMENMQKQSEES